MNAALKITRKKPDGQGTGKINQPSPKGLQPQGDAANAAPKNTTRAQVEEKRVLSGEEKALLAGCIKTIQTSERDSAEDFAKLAAAIHTILEHKLYLGSHIKAAAFFKERLGYARSHSYRLGQAGAILRRVSPQGDTAKLFVSEAHFRPLAKLSDSDQDKIMELVNSWARMADQDAVSPKMVEAAVALSQPAATPKASKSARMKLIGKFTEIIEDSKKNLPRNAPEEVKRLFPEMKRKAVALGGPRSTTGIDWTNSTWNPLQGCSRASAGCDRCYAAKLLATPMADVYPGLATKRVEDGKARYFFNNKILLLPEQFGIPLLDRVPKRFFVNSMSDLFHDKVPDEFIRTVFQIMEKTSWHHYQVLTKRPERMAAFSREYYRDHEPPANIWLGTSAEDQENFDERFPHLLKTKSAIRWLSFEPLIGQIKFKSLAGVHWCVVGGESDSVRKMEKAWAISIRDQCKRANAPFFFKQWGGFQRGGNKEAET
jgi:protein gp37